MPSKPLRFPLDSLWPLTLALAAFGAACGAADGLEVAPLAREQAIIGGVESAQEDFPTTGAILVWAYHPWQGPKGAFHCSATLIAPDVILTAAHCAELPPQAQGYQDVHFYFTLDPDASEFGEDNGFVLPPSTVDVREAIAHPEWGGQGSMQNVTGLADLKDVALMFLASPITTVTPMVVASPAQASATLSAGLEVMISGYGATTFNAYSNGPGANTDDGGAVKHHATTVLNEVGAAEMQIGTQLPVPQKCHGDSGGPTYVDFDDGLLPVRRVVGITSRAYNQLDCQVGGVDTRADRHWDWINATMIEGCAEDRRVRCDGDGGLSVASEASAVDIGDGDGDSGGDETTDGGEDIAVGGDEPGGAPDAGPDASGVGDDGDGDGDAPEAAADAGPDASGVGGAGDASDEGDAVENDSDQFPAPMSCANASGGATPALLAGLFIAVARRRRRR